MTLQSPRLTLLRFTSAVLFGSLLPAAALAQNTATTQTHPTGSNHSMVRTPTETNGGGVIIPPQTDGHMNIAAPPGDATSPYPPQSTLRTPDGGGNPTGATTGN